MNGISILLLVNRQEIGITELIVDMDFMYSLMKMDNRKQQMLHMFILVREIENYQENYLFVID